MFATDQYTVRKVKPYNPAKAGAAIVESFEITGRIYAYSSPLRIVPGYDLAEFNDCIYIRVNRTLLIYNKNTHQKTTEREIRFSGSGSNHVIGGGMVITGDKALLICHLSGHSRMNLVSLDLSNGDTEIINDTEALGIDLGLSYDEFMGYDEENDRIWFLVKNDENDQYCFYFYSYDNDTQTFILEDTKAWFNAGSYTIYSENPVVYITNGVSLYGSEIWDTAYSWNGHSPEPTMVGLHKRTLDNPDKLINFIDVEYLGTLSTPESIIYDKPYIWIMVVRNDKIEMLKLLPNG
jgi:hypothetical protein